LARRGDLTVLAEVGDLEDCTVGCIKVLKADDPGKREGGEEGEKGKSQIGLSRLIEEKNEAYLTDEIVIVVHLEILNGKGLATCRVRASDDLDHRRESRERAVRRVRSELRDELRSSTERAITKETIRRVSSKFEGWKAEGRRPNKG